MGWQTVPVEERQGLWYGARKMSDEIEAELEQLFPKREPKTGPGRPRTIWAPDVFWDELAAVAKAENNSTSEFVLKLIRVGYAAFKKQRAKQEP